MFCEQNYYVPLPHACPGKNSNEEDTLIFCYQKNLSLNEERFVIVHSLSLLSIKGFRLASG
jgi:hypothetical protein